MCPKPSPLPHLLPQNQGWENGAFWLFRGFILDLGGEGGGEGGGKWGFAFPFYSVQDCKSDRFYQIKLEAEAIANESTC